MIFGHKKEYLLSSSREHLKISLGLEISCFMLQVSKYTHKEKRHKAQHQINRINSSDIIF